MRKTFEETKIGRFFSVLTDVLIAGLFWILCSLPIVTIGPATAALYYVTVKSIRHERGRLTKTFFGAFRSNFSAGIRLWFIYCLCAGVYWQQLCSCRSGRECIWDFEYVCEANVHSHGDAAALAVCIRVQI